MLGFVGTISIAAVIGCFAAFVVFSLLALRGLEALWSGLPLVLLTGILAGGATVWMLHP